MSDHVLITRLRAGGIVNPRMAIDEARRAGLPLAFACALLEKESSGGHNVFGHDASIFSGRGAVTREKYLAYKRLRGRTKMQGVGPVQLTWWELQDAADREGGCWRPEVNMRIGFRHLATLIHQYGESDGARRYNGSGAAAVAYSADLLARARRWERILADVPGASAGNGHHNGGRHGAGDRRVDDHRAGDRPGAGHGAGDRRVDDHRAGDRPRAGHRAGDPPAADQRAGDRPGAGHRAGDHRVGGRPAAGGAMDRDSHGRRGADPAGAGRPMPSGGQLRQAVRSSMIERGAHGDVVRRLTRCLTFLEYLDGARDRFDGETEHALIAFQRDHRLEVDGVLGPESAEAIAHAVRRANDDRVDGRADKVLRTDERSDIALDHLIAYGAKLRARLDAARTKTGSAELTAELISEIGTTLLRIEAHVAALAADTESAQAAASAGSPPAAASAGSPPAASAESSLASAESPSPAKSTRRKSKSAAVSATSQSAVATTAGSEPVSAVSAAAPSAVAATTGSGPAPAMASATSTAPASTSASPSGGVAAPPLHATVPLSGAVAHQLGADAVNATFTQLAPAGETDEALAARLETLDAEMDATVQVLIERFEGYERELAELEPHAPRERRRGGRFVREPDDAAGPGARPARPGGGADRGAGGHGGHGGKGGHKPAPPKRQPARGAKPKHMPERAYRVAAGLVGVMEVGGNNAGAKVTEIIRANGGTGPEPWCGDFVAYCYRLSGSKAVTRNWAAVRLLRGASGVTATRKPRRGDLVRYTFDHVGMFVRDRGDGTIETIEGNTGASGAVSDSRTGGDGVYRKVRPKSLVKDYLRVHR